MKRILVTGGSGFVGRQLIAGLLGGYPGAEITSISRSEGAICQLMTRCATGRLKVVIGDVRDRQAMKLWLRGQDTVIHLAAMKRVDLCEEECRQAIVTNVLGTMNILDGFRGDTFVLMSTDKAVEPVNCYGASKLLAEKLVLERARKDGGKARYMIVRSGNVAGSTGSVLDIWMQQIAQRNEITLTDPNMMRLFITVDHLVKLLLAVLERGESGKIYVTPRGEGVSIGELADAAVKVYGNDQTRITIVGSRPGEKLREKTHVADDPSVVVGFIASQDDLVAEDVLSWISDGRPRPSLYTVEARS